MTRPGTDKRTIIIGGTYVAIVAFAVLSSWALHEWSHWLTGNILGYEMAMTLNTAYPVSGIYDPGTDYQIVSAAGPAVTLLEAIIVFMIMRGKNIVLIYPFLFVPFYMRLLAFALSFIRPNDEARISTFLGLGTFTILLIMTVILFMLVYSISRSYQFSLKFNLYNLALVILFTSIIILYNQFLGGRIL